MKVFTVLEVISCGFFVEACNTVFFCNSVRIETTAAFSEQDALRVGYCNLTADVDQEGDCTAVSFGS